MRKRGKGCWGIRHFDAADGDETRALLFSLPLKINLDFAFHLKQTEKNKTGAPLRESRCF